MVETSKIAETVKIISMDKLEDVVHRARSVNIVHIVKIENTTKDGEDDEDSEDGEDGEDVVYCRDGADSEDGKFMSIIVKLMQIPKMGK